MDYIRVTNFLLRFFNALIQILGNPGKMKLLDDF